MDIKQVAGVIIEQENKILFHKRNYPPGKNKLDLVGGYIEFGETPEQAAIRETKEETGYDTKLLHKIIDQDYFDQVPKHLHLYLAEIIDGNEKQSSEGKPIWTQVNNISQEIFAFPHAYKFIMKYLNQKNPSPSAN